MYIPKGNKILMKKKENSTKDKRNKNVRPPLQELQEAEG